MSRGATLAACALMLLVALAGCIGGGSEGPSQQTADPGGPGEGPGGNGTGTNGTGSGDRPHVHDRWDGQETRTLFDDSVTLEAVTQDEPLLLRGCKFSARDICYGSAEFAPETTGEGTGEIVPPGTDYVNVTIGYSDSDFEMLRLYWKNRIADGDCINGWDCRAILTSGETFTINVSDVRQTDDGHAKVSAWRFALDALGNPTGEQPPVGPNVHYGEGEVDVEMVAHRVEGELPYEPPHPDFWIDTDVYRVGYLEGHTDQMAQAGFVYAEPSPPDGACPTSYQSLCVPAGVGQGIQWDIVPGYLGERTRGQEEDPARLDGPSPIALVPPETSKIGGIVELDGDAPRPVRVCLEAFFSPDQPASRVGCGTFDDGSGTATWELPIQGDKVDSYYADNWGANQSRWRFRVRLSAQEQGPTYSATAFSGDVTVSILASRMTEAAPPDWAMDPPS